MFWICFACARPPAVEMAPCPSSPNCVSSLAPKGDPHRVEPLVIDGDAGWARLHEVILGMPRVKLIEERPDYRHYTFTTLIFRFVDDVEIRRDGDIAHIRSASRVGHSDLGVNRRRVEAIRARMAR